MTSQNIFHVYMIKCMNGCFYTGHTSDLERRVKEHASGRGAKYIRSFGFSEVVYSERHPTRSDAMKRENEIKKLTRKEKIKLAGENKAGKKHI